MHTWALFSCSSLVTLTAYNLAQLPQAQSSGASPEPEKDTGNPLAIDPKFSLDALSAEFPEYEPPIAGPTSTNQPQLSQWDTVPEYDAMTQGLANATAPGKDVDAVLAQLSAQTDAPPSLEKGATYRVDSIQPLPAAIPEPLLTSPAVMPPTAAALTTPPVAIAQPQPEPATATPTFARTFPPASPQTTAPAAPAGIVVAASPSVADDTTATPAEADLFAALPIATAARPDTPTADPDSRLMAEHQEDQTVTVVEPVQTVSDSISAISMETAIARYQEATICKTQRAGDSFLNRAEVCQEGTRELTQRMPEATVAGTPIPGSVESPTLNKPGTGVW